MSKRFVDPTLFVPWCLVFLISLIWLLSGPVHAQSQPQGSSVSAPKNILLIYSYGDGLLAYQQATRAFLSVMEGGAKEGVVSEKSLFFEYLDLERKKDIEHYRNLTTLLLHKYTTQKIDLIVTVHGPALKFLLNEGRDLSPGTPVLSYLGPETIETTGIERRFVLLPMSMDIRGTLQLAQKLFPQTMRVVFVNGTGEGEKRLEQEAKGVFAQWPDKLEFEYTSDLSVEEMLQRIAALSPGTIVIYSNVFTDKTGRNFVAREVAEMVAKAAKVPVFGMYNTLLGRGIIGGSIFNFEAEGARAGMLALDILRGKLPLSKPTTILRAQRTPMFDWQQLKRWGVKVNVLPEGRIIVNHPPTVWNQYKVYVIVAIAFCLAEAVLIFILILQMRRRRVAEEALRERLQFETLLAEISTRFVNLSADRIDNEIANTQRRICEFLDLDRSSLGQVLEQEPGALLLTHIHQPPGGPPITKPLNAMDYFPWSTQKVLGGETVAITKMSDLPPEAGRDRENYGLYGTKSVVAVPLSAGEGPVFGLLTFAVLREERSWPETVVMRFKLIAQVFANALARKQVEQALRESEERLSIALDSAETGLWIMNVSTGLVWATPKLRELFQFAPDAELSFERFLAAIHPDDRESVKGLVRQSLETRELVRFEYRVVHPDGNIRWILARGRCYPKTEGPPERLMGSSIDITVRKEMAAKIEKAAEEWQATFDSIADMVMILDHEMRILRINAAAASYFRLPSDEIIGAKCYTAMFRTEKPPESSPYVTIMKSKHHEQVEFLDIIRNRWLNVSIDPVLDDRGEVRQVIHTSRDITEQKKAQAEAFLARRQLLRTERLLRMGELTASLAHELNQPLTSILNNAKAAIRFIKADRFNMKQLMEILEDIAKADKRAGDIIRNLRSMVRPEEGEQELIGINDLLSGTIALFNSEAIIRNVRIETEFAGFLLPVRANRVQLQQVLINLMMNAAESMIDARENRTIVVQTRAGDADKVQVAVRDFGPGIDAKDLDRIFEAFFTTKRSGLGMGLSLSRSIIEAQGGHIWAENNPDKGVTFYFDLPGVRE